MFCLKCGKDLKSAGLCPFCQHDNSEKSDNNYFKSDEMLELYRDDPDFELIFGNTPAKEQPKKKDLVFSSNEKPHEQPVVKPVKAAPVNNSVQFSIPSTGPANMPTQPDMQSSGYGQQRVIYSSDARRDNIGNADPGRANNTNERIEAYEATLPIKKKFNFVPIVIFLMLAIGVLLIIFAVKIFGGSDDKKDDRSDKESVPAVQDETRPEEESISPIDENTEPGNEEDTEEYTMEMPTEDSPDEETSDPTQGGRQEKWSEEAVALENLILDKKNMFDGHDDSIIREKCQQLKPLENGFENFDFYYQEEKDNLEHFDAVLNGSGDSLADRTCGKFNNLNMYYFVDKGTEPSTRQYLLVSDENGEDSRINEKDIGMLSINWIHWEDNNNQCPFAYMTLSYKDKIEYYVVNVHEWTVYDMDSVIELLNQDETSSNQQESSPQNEPDIPAYNAQETTFNNGEG